MTHEATLMSGIILIAVPGILSVHAFARHPYAEPSCTTHLCGSSDTRVVCRNPRRWAASIVRGKVSRLGSNDLLQGWFAQPQDYDLRGGYSCRPEDPIDADCRSHLLRTIDSVGNHPAAHRAVQFLGP